MKVIVLGGGTSPEREVSLRSAAAVSKALKQAGAEVVDIDPKNGLEILDRQKDVIVFPILHGQNGEDGTIQRELEVRNLPYLGTDSTTSAKCFDKWQTRLALLAAKLPMARGDLVTSDTYYGHPLTKQPHVLKVTHGGSSIGTYIVKDPRKVDSKLVKDVFQLHERAVIEELVEGIEITVPILDDKALPVIEIRPPADADFDYENKYNGVTSELCPPRSLDKDQQNQAQTLAEKVHRTMGCRHLSRTDIIMKPDGSFIVLEINTIPGMTEQSLYPKSASVAGISMPKLMSAFVDLVKRDYGINE
ncbi:MAG TPA: D-alanine--D-alanine ligase [Patescibacteria group bacterium]|nr:D-alanine--D-alanine ligase [Patescibacteria group bacterium]